MASDDTAIRSRCMTAKTMIFLLNPLWITVLPFVRSTTSEGVRCVRREEKPCSWYCSDLGEVDFQADSFHGISIQCVPGNHVYTIDLCGNLPCLGQAGVMACSNVTGPAMNLSAVIVTTSVNRNQRTGLQINFHGSNFSIALTEGFPGVVCVNANDSFQVFLDVLNYPIVPPVTQPKGVPITGIVVGAVAAIILIFCTVVVIVCCVRYCCCRGKRVDTATATTAKLLVQH